MTILMSATMFAAIALSEPNVQRAPTPIRPGWLVMQLAEKVQFHFLPLAVRPQDYPKSERRGDGDRTSLLNLQVSPKGRLLSCTTARSSGSVILDDQACKLYRSRGRFQLRGTTEAVTVQAPVRWVLVD